jgi:hypothetical protein
MRLDKYNVGLYGGQLLGTFFQVIGDAQMDGLAVGQPGKDFPEPGYVGYQQQVGHDCIPLILIGALYGKR